MLLAVHMLYLCTPMLCCPSARLPCECSQNAWLSLARQQAARPCSCQATCLSSLQHLACCAFHIARVSHGDSLSSMLPADCLSFHHASADLVYNVSGNLPTSCATFDSTYGQWIENPLAPKYGASYHTCMQPCVPAAPSAHPHICLPASPLLHYKLPAPADANGTMVPASDAVQQLRGQVCVDPQSFGQQLATAVQAGGQQAQDTVQALLSVECISAAGQALQVAYNAVAGTPPDLQAVLR